MALFSGLRVLDLSPTRVGAQISQLLGDFGADVIWVEPPGGAELRSRAAFPFWARGKRSIVLDPESSADRAVLLGLAARADVVIDTHRPGGLEAIGLGYPALSAVNPRVILASVTAFGRQGPMVGAPAYEHLVMAKLGVFRAFRRMSNYPHPPFVAAPFASFPAAQVALHGILTALIERQTSGAGQWVETNLAQAFTTLDTWAWFEHLIAARWPEAFHTTDAFDAEGRPASPLSFMLMVALTRDGSWLQFAAVAPRLFAAKMKALGLDWMFSAEEWKGLPALADADQRMALWTRMLEAAHDKTLAEWQAIFDADPDVFAEQFRTGAALLRHPQLVHDGAVVELRDAERGPVRQPGALVRASVTPAELGAGAPTLDEHRHAVLAEAAEPPGPIAPPGKAPRRLPLEGITILELATLFAAPHGTTMLTDLGARVIKVEPLAGDMIRTIIAFPESGGAKVMQGKDSICVDLSTPDGLALVQEIARGVDVVVQGFRAGAITRLHLDYDTIRVGNPDVVYVNAPGYGVDGPYGGRPAYAPSIGAATGLALTNAGQTVPEGADLTIAQIRDGARRLSAAAAMSNAQADGFAALGVATAILTGLAARALGAGGQELFTSMVTTGVHAMSAQAVIYPGAPEEPSTDPELRGFGPLYREYDAADGYVFLAAPSDRDWVALAAALKPHLDLASDSRFGDAAARARHGTALTATLAALFATRPAPEWEEELLGAGVGCVAVNTDSIESLLFDDRFGRASGYVVDVVHPTFDEHPRLAPYLRFSRSLTQARPGVLAGQSTDAILSELGRSAEQIADLRERRIVG